MKDTSPHTSKNLNTLGLILTLAALAPLLCLTGCTTGNRYQQSTGEYIDDHTLSAAVKNALGKDMQYKFEDVKVTTFKGVVQLSGFASTAEQKERAGGLAMAVEGVKEVVNSIAIKK